MSDPPWVATGINTGILFDDDHVAAMREWHQAMERIGLEAAIEKERQFVEAFFRQNPDATCVFRKQQEPA